MHEVNLRHFWQRSAEEALHLAFPAAQLLHLQVFVPYPHLEAGLRREKQARDPLVLLFSQPVLIAQQLLEVRREQVG